MTDREKELLEVCERAYRALSHLASYPAFGDTAPEFNAGGVGREACIELRQVLEHGGLKR